MDIFVADVTDDYRLSRKRLIKELEEKKAKVHHGLPPPFEMELHDNIFNSTISDCDLSIHILSQYPGRTFEDLQDVYISLHQASVGLNQNKRKVFWIPKSLELEKVDETTYREFLSTLEYGFDDDSFVLVKGDPQTLHEDIVNVISFPHENVLRNGTLIVHHAKDVDLAIRVREQARQRNIQTQYNSSDDANPAASLKLLTDQLRDVKNVIMVIGAVNYEWANERAKHILSTLIQMEFELESIAFYFAGRATSFSFNGRFMTVRILDETNGDQDKSAWDNFLSTGKKTS
jgi:hypothetical protein